MGLKRALRTLQIRGTKASSKLGFLTVSKSQPIRNFKITTQALCQIPLRERQNRHPSHLITHVNLLK